MRNRRRISSGSIGAAAALVVSAMALPATAQNLLLNPSFEAPTDNSGANTDTEATGWNFYDSAVRAEFAAHTGTWGIWDETFAPGGIGDGGVYQNVGNITDGTTYTLTGWQYFESAASTVPNLTSDLALTFLNSSGTAVGSTDPNGYSDALYTPAATQTAGTWTQYTVTGVAPAGATQVQVSFDFANGSTVSGAQGIFVDDAELLGAGIPPTSAEWASNASGDWNQTGNWTTGSVPNAVGAEADFFTTPGITSNSTIYTNSAVIAGALKFNNPNEYEITGTGSLTLEATSGSALVSVNQATDILDLPITVASNTVFNVELGATLIVGNPITVNSGLTLTQTGTGTVKYWSTVTVDSNAAMSMNSSTYAHQLTVDSNATATIGTSSGGVIVQVDSLTNAGTVNLSANELLISYGSGPDPIASIAALLKSGYNGGAWNGVGIDTNAPLIVGGLSYGLGYADSADPGNPAQLSSGTVEVRYTLLGDADLNGIVNGIDFGILAANFNKGETGWDEGDFDYNNIVNGLDFGDLAANFNKGAAGPAAVAALDAFAAANGLLADVPEPASAGLLAVTAVAALSRRRGRLVR